MNKQNRGFTLIELMIVVAVIGVLASVGYPAYVDSLKKANRADAVEGLLSLAGRMEEYYMTNDSYSGATVTSAGDGTVGSNKTKDDKYTLSITAATNFTYSLTATAKESDPECLTLTLDAKGTKGSTGSGSNCW